MDAFVRRGVFGVIAVLTFASSAAAQTLNGPELVAALRAGGHVIVMRHASSPRDVPDKKAANPDNTTPERQLDEKGRASATAMGEALRRLKIPVGEVLTSAAYRARETAKLARLPEPRVVVELGEANQSMQSASRAQAEWLQKRVRDLPRGSNTLVITHSPNIGGAFPDFASVADGEALVFGPDGKGGSRVVARVKIEDWSSL
jgi:phosphohistidine phosphatase SixA